MKFYLTSNLDFDNFASKHNTDHAILSIADKIQNSIEGRQYSRGVFLDFSKAFDTVSHNILLMKSEHYGISAKKLSLFEYFGETLFNALIYLFLTNGILIWGNTYQTTIKPIFILQKKAVRIITFPKLDSHSGPLFKSLGLIKLFDSVLFQIS